MAGIGPLALVAAAFAKLADFAIPEAGMAAMESLRRIGAHLGDSELATDLGL